MKIIQAAAGAAQTLTKVRRYYNPEALDALIEVRRNWIVDPELQC